MQMININLPDNIERRLKGEASRRGIAAEEYASRLIVQNLPPQDSSTTLVELFAQWEKEDESPDPLEIARRQKDLDELKASLNKNRKESEGSEARQPYP
jgi:hypothetical protein